MGYNMNMKLKCFFRLALLSFIFYTPLIAQTSGVSMPKIDSISMPGSSSFPSMSSQSQNPQTQSATSTNESQNSITNSQYVTAASLATLSSSILGTSESSSNNLLSSILGGSSNLTATANATTTNVLLEQILNKLNENQDNSTAKKVSSTETNEKTTNTPVYPYSTGGAKILRCTTNGYNILSTCRTIYSSVLTTDGTFLITGDRKYLSNHRTRSETFYMLFKKTSPHTYEVAVSVLQDYLNEYSFLYQLSERSPFIASATGNLIVLRIDEELWKFDMLIDITDMYIPDDPEDFLVEEQEESDDAIEE